MNTIDSEQAKALSKLVYYNFLVSIVSIYSDYMTLKISYAKEEHVTGIEKLCAPCKTEITWDGTYIFVKVYTGRMSK